MPPPQPLSVQHREELRFAPFYADAEQWEYAGLLEPWPVLTRATAADTAPLASVDFVAAGDSIEECGVFGLSIEGASGLRLYSDRPISTLGSGSIAVAADGSDLAMLQIVLAYRYRVWPQVFVTPDQPHDALLSREAMTNAAYVYDMGEEWQRWQGLPLVEALWAIRANAAPLAHGVVKYLLGDSIQHAQTEPQKIAAQYGLTAAEVTQYFANRRFRLTAADHESFDLFRRLWLNLPAQIAAIAPAQRELEKLAA